MQSIAGEEGSAYRRKGKHFSMCVSICRNLPTEFPIASKRCWRADATICVVKGKHGIFCKDRSVLLCSELMLPSLTLPALLFCSSLSQSISLQFYAASAGVVSQFSTRRLLLKDLFHAVCWERQCMGSTGGVGDFSCPQV